MIRHDDKIAHLHLFEPFAQAPPFVHRNGPPWVQADGTVGDLAEQRLALVSH